jgi:hypothetical protein
MVARYLAREYAMTTYKVFNGNNVATKVSDDDLERAALATGPLATELCNAAALAKRHDLTSRLKQTVAEGASRLQKLAAARALLALDCKDAVGVLDAASADPQDKICATMLRAISLRLRGTGEFERAFEGSADPELAGFLVSVYTGVGLDLTLADARFLVAALAAYLDRSLPWIKHMPADEWRNDLYIVLEVLTRPASVLLLQTAEAEPIRRPLLEQLTRVSSSRAGGDEKRMAKKLLASLEPALCR